MFYEKHKSSYLVTIFYYVINTVYIYSWKQIDKILTHFSNSFCDLLLVLQEYDALSLKI